MTGVRIGPQAIIALLDQLATAGDFSEALHPAPARPMDSRGIVEFFDVPTGQAFDVPPEKAIDYFQRKGLQPTFSYADMIGEAHDKAFTVAKLMDVDMLGKVRESLDLALANGQPYREWADTIIAQLHAGGWFGRKAVLDPLTGAEMVTEISAPWRLETIFRTNLQTAYAAGLQEVIDSQADVAPYLMYDAVDDHRTRETHRARDGTILPVGHPWWTRNTPPLGYNCRCGLIQLDADQLEAMGLEVSKAPPPLETVPWTNPRTGEASAWPEGVDPGFGRIPGSSRDLERTLREKTANLPPDMQNAVAPTLAQDAKREAMDAARNYGTGTRASDGATAKLLKSAQARAQQAEKQLAAQATIDAMANAGDEWQRAAHAELAQDAGWRALSATERLRDLKRRARELQRRA